MDPASPVQRCPTCATCATWSPPHLSDAIQHCVFHAHVAPSLVNLRCLEPSTAHLVPHGPRARGPRPRVGLAEANRSLAAKSVVDMLREHQQKFGSNACNASDPAPFTGAGARQSILVSAFSPASRLSFETHRRSKSLEKDSIPPVHSVTDDIVDSLMNGAVMEQLLNNRRNSKVVSGDCEATSAC